MTPRSVIHYRINSASPNNTHKCQSTVTMGTAPKGLKLRNCFHKNVQKMLYPLLKNIVSLHKKYGELKLNLNFSLTLIKHELV